MSRPTVIRHGDPCEVAKSILSRKVPETMKARQLFHRSEFGQLM
ncbi:hypothetical protein RESH_04545 [Rhodopirellula europaea SH398]|uniref:Uncharacterized protein n=1 Tax=Rhodopirellula europaea SH398 TaxID=1263868 RepID=M5S0L0_9BACT|nr:hypothetical protein RESH_04545 [Rhodopirellula europaea SH398]